MSLSLKAIPKLCAANHLFKIASRISDGAATENMECGIHSMRELSFLKLGTGVEEFLKGARYFGLISLGHQIFWQNYRLSNGL